MVSGRGARSYLRRLLANDIDSLDDRVAGIYSCLLNDSGCVIDDLIAYRLTDERYRVVSNAATVDSVRAQMRKIARAFPVTLVPEEDRVTLAVQGPQAMEAGAAAAAVLGGEFAAELAALKPFNAMESRGFLAARTGYTGEDGFEIYLGRGNGAGALGRRCSRPTLRPADWERATPCGWRRACACTARTWTTR